MTDTAPARDLLVDTFTRVRELVEELTDGLSAEDSTWRPDPGANTRGWLLWHLTRIQDDHVAGLAGVRQAWPRLTRAVRHPVPVTGIPATARARTRSGRFGSPARSC